MAQKESSKSMIRKSRTFHASDIEYRMIQDYARSKGRSISGFMVSAAMSEINKHVPRQGLAELVRSIVREELKSVSPRGETC